MKFIKLYIFFVSIKRTYNEYNEFNTDIIQNEWYIYEFKKH